MTSDKLCFVPPATHAIQAPTAPYDRNAVYSLYEGHPHESQCGVSSTACTHRVRQTQASLPQALWIKTALEIRRRKWRRRRFGRSARAIQGAPGATTRL